MGETLRIANRKRYYFNSYRVVKCRKCGTDLHRQYLLSTPNKKYYCKDCAVRLNFIDEEVISSD